jgi:hypothetical protein
MIYDLNHMCAASSSPQAETEGSVRQVAVPLAVRALSTLPRIDYQDAFSVDVPQAQGRTAEQWARAVLEAAPPAVRHTLVSGWSAIGLKLRRGPSERFVLGWEVRQSALDFVLLAAGSRIGMPAELLFKRERQALLFSTFVQHENPIARTLWAGIEPVHVPVVRYVLEQASRRC